jgi:serine/threonine protein kinase
MIQVGCPNCGAENQLDDSTKVEAPSCRACGRPLSSTRNETVNDTHSHREGPAAVAAVVPERIGRYRVGKILGEGSFGRIYLAHDDDLNRPVAIKVPHPERVVSAQDAEAFLAEARAVASLDHPNIVPVHDVGRTDDGLCFVVSKLIEGSDLATRIEQGRLPFPHAVEVVATLAEALHHAHGKGLVHRDVKSKNVLLDASGKAYLADFGLALKEEDYGQGTRFAGTPAYMSPEQARSQGHHVDGRSDIFSLGVVFYELLTGRRPFQGKTVAEVLEQVTTVEARPPRQVDDTIPREIERVCLKALAKNLPDRYTTARDMAEELRRFQRKRATRTSVSQPGTPKRRLAVAVSVILLIAALGAVWHFFPRGGPDPANQPVNAGNIVYLSGLNHIEAKNWARGSGLGKATVRGKPSPHGLFMHPTPDGRTCCVAYDLDAQYQTFESEVSLNDSSLSSPPLVFSVHGDGKLLWKSNPVKSQADAQQVNISIQGVDVLQLGVTVEGNEFLGAHAVWVEPRVVK